MSDRDDLSSYFARIGYAGAAAPTREVLGAIVLAHAIAIPFENLDPLLGRPIRLDRDSLFDKLVARRRGGYCFEHNTLLATVLREIGFVVEGLAARVLWGRPADMPDDTAGPRTHMLLRVTLPEGAFLTDVGFGGVTLTAPLAFVAETEQPTPHEPHRLLRTGDRHELQAKLGEQWTPLYRFSNEAQFPIDYEVANWFTATYPQSLFTNNLLCARPDRDRRHALLNRTLSIHHRDGSKDQVTLARADELGEALERAFHIDLSSVDVAAAFASLPNEAES